MIRTLDPLLPKQVRYQAALYSVRVRNGPDGGYITVPALLFKPVFDPAAVIARVSQTVYQPRRWGVAKW